MTNLPLALVAILRLYLALRLLVWVRARTPQQRDHVDVTNKHRRSQRQQALPVGIRRDATVERSDDLNVIDPRDGLHQLLFGTL